MIKLNEVNISKQKTNHNRDQQYKVCVRYVFLTDFTSHVDSYLYSAKNRGKSITKTQLKEYDLHLTVIWIVDIVHDKTFKQANGILQEKLKQNMQLGLSKPYQHKPIITQNDFQNITE